MSLEDRIEELEDKIDKLEKKEKKRKTFSIIKTSISIVLVIAFALICLKVYNNFMDIIRPYKEVLEQYEDIKGQLNPFQDLFK